MRKANDNRTNTHKKGRLSLLTAQERKVLKLVTESLANKEIAATLGISPSTVKRHLEHILRKLHVKNRVAAAVYAVRRGDFPLEADGIERAV